MKITHSKIYTCIEVFPYAVTFDKSDIFASPKTDKVWGDLCKYITIKQLAHPDKMNKSFQNIAKQMHLANAMVDYGQKKGDSEFTKKMY